VPPPNKSRRRALADAAIELLATSGVHGVTHRAVEKAAGMPTGTASNYFRSREALLIAAAERVLELHAADMDTAAGQHEPAPGTSDRERMAELITRSLYEAATLHRQRYLAIFELRLEALRIPALAETLAGIERGARDVTALHHGAVGLAVPTDRIPALLLLYGGALFTLVSTPADEVTEAGARLAADAIARVAFAA
jgi:AcrR family transcriptional regulator